jgi:hypothetical protein
MPTAPFSPDAFLASLHVPIEELPPSKMGKADARTYHPPGGQRGPVKVVVNKKLAAERRRWVLTHEAAHVIDCATRVGPGEWVGHPCFLGYGRLSTGISKALLDHEKFLIGLRATVLTYRIGEKVMTLDEVMAAPDIEPRMKNRIRMKGFEASVRHLRYKTQAVELFAEALACALCEPERFDRGAPGLRDALKAVVAAEGIQL